MDPGLRTPLVDLFRRGEVPQDIRLLAARGTLVPDAQEQIALLVLLSDDPDGEIATAARQTVGTLPEVPLRAFLARSGVPAEIRAFFAARGVEPAAAEDGGGQVLEAAVDAEDAADGESDPRILSGLSILKRMKIAMKGTREQRAQLIRDSNKLVAAAVLSSPKLTESEVEGFAKMANVSEEVLRVIAMNRTWTKNYGVVLGLTRNPKTPLAISMQLLHRLNERDLKGLSVDRNVPEALRVAARKVVVKSTHR